MTANLNINIALPGASPERSSQEAAPSPVELSQGQANISYGAAPPAPLDLGVIDAMASGAAMGAAPSPADLAQEQAGIIDDAGGPPAPLDPATLAALAGGSALGVAGSEPPPPTDIAQVVALAGGSVGEAGGPPPPAQNEDTAAGMPVDAGLPPEPIPPDEMAEEASSEGDAGDEEQENPRSGPRNRR